MTIEEAQQLVEVWNAKHPVERCTCGNEGDGSPVRATAATPASPGTSPAATQAPEPVTAAAPARIAPPTHRPPQYWAAVSGNCSPRRTGSRWT
ncbi:hypothetical protein [Alistipes indistinctus]|uniref:hypothetical protein n=1 Tax=Alistipes indistinctus TaxID=626932 RepID=UPI0011C710D6|nr:hypothetical protein [Alistipes indistinctus]